VRILIANHIDPSIRDRTDLRAWTQRIFWFAQSGDVVILSTMPDQDFLTYSLSLTGVNPATVRIVIAPSGRYGGRLLDPETLTDPQFITEILDTCESAIEEIFALWPSASVARFARALGVPDAFCGATFFAQGGGELCNNKAVFRAMAAGADIRIPAGDVCHDECAAINATYELLSLGGAVVVKQAHNGAGVGNELVVRDTTLAVDHVGARNLHTLVGSHAIEDYWRQRWDWASANHRFPVVVEQFQPQAQTIYSEHFITKDAIQSTERGSLHYVARHLDHEIVPLRSPNADIETQLLCGARRLADAYRNFGYRGYLSADAVVGPDGQVVFTEVNAQVSGSLHIYQIIAHQIVDVYAAPERSVVQYHVAPHWAVPDLGTFLNVAAELGYDYDPVTRTGIIVSMPAIPQVAGRAQFVFCIAYPSTKKHRDIWQALNQEFSTSDRADD
jgi:hypothetical protein